MIQTQIFKKLLMIHMGVNIEQITNLIGTS